ncbi:dehydrogenase E1 protein subunits alpha/beta [Kitasatospora phosalacinea]|uniref:dihydrolipoyllysine-residue succinyltransferase n=1 Tax=Kitasatospora phosalacinea TaxID=2065 RepID=A0A9W6Q6A6_9ACTN|nr:alpha-ketoacid dehydrogenase subunit alpha/beta [Kitasatospora phosalacinea]GLW69313.1 dehydrogenase E1 protein subunits alpha/beta [Kitasatospora phosalacinea]
MLNPPPGPEPDDADLAALLLIRHVELALLRLFGEGLVSGTTHTCLGQEYVPVALAPLLGAADMVFSNHRGHGHYLALTGDAEGLLAEVLGRQGAVCGGAGGSQHLYTDGFLSTGVQGESLPVAVGAALRRARDGAGALALAFVGDGTWGEGAVYEALNLAALWRAPLVVVVEHNGIAQSTPTERQLAGSIGARAAAFGIAHHRSSTSEVSSLRAELAPLLEQVRSGAGPLVVELDVPRLGPHSKGDDTRGAEELAVLGARDWYRVRAGASEERFAAWDAKQSALVEALVAEVVSRPPSDGRARTASTPPAVPENAVPEKPVPQNAVPANPVPQDAVPERVAENLNRALHELMAADPSVHLLGEDVSDPYGGAFKVTRGLSTRFGERVRSTPLSEGAITGVGAGLALAGERAVVEMMFGDFVTLAFDQLVNFAAKSVSMYGRRVPVPLLVRCPVGGRRGYGATHSQSPQKHLTGVPDLDLYELSPFHDAVPLVRHALSTGNPSVLFEDKVLYTERRFTGDTVDEVLHWRLDGGSALGSALGTAVVGPAGVERPDAVVIAPGGLARRAVGALRTLLLEDELCVRLLVPARLYPLDADRLAELCGRAPAVVVVEDGTPGAGWGTEVAQALHTRLWSVLRAPVRVLTAADRPVPAAPHLEDEVFVRDEDIRRAVRALAEQVATERGSTECGEERWR